MSILTSWSAFFQSTARMEGRSYQSSDRVQRVPPENEDELVRAEVRDGELHTVSIRKQGSRAVAECTCATFDSGAYCKHIWAALLDVQQHDDGPGAAAEQLAGLRVRAPKARKRDEGERPSRNAEPEWVGRLSLLRPPTYEMEGGAGSDLLPAQRQICYVVLPEASSQHHSLVIELRQRTPIATGWSKSRPFKVGLDALRGLDDPVDRELCALVLGARQLDDARVLGSLSGRSSCRYQLPSGAWRSLLRRMIATGRCYFDPDEDASRNDEVELRHFSDEPWVLWLMGSESEQGLTVDVVLRRDGRQMGIEKPRLILGGPDGLVLWEDGAAAFDDRDAFRWAGQFRDDFDRRGEVKPIEVPKEEIERFLDRLYLLPQLPEIDLPEGIGRVPRQVEPVMHLDLFGPETGPGRRLLSDAGSSRGQVAGRVWFEYEQQRVSPVQPGRFVTISPPSDASADQGIVPATAAARPVSPSAPPPEVVSEGSADVLNAFGDDEDLGDVASELTGREGAMTLMAEDDEPAQDRDVDDADLPLRDAQAAALESAMPEGGLLIRRSRRKEREALALLLQCGFRPISGTAGDALTIGAKLVSEVVGTLLQRGWNVSADQKMIRAAGVPSLSITSGIDWFELHGGIRFQRDDGQFQDVTLPEILAAVRAGQQMIALGDGSQGLVPQQWLAEHGLLTSLGRVEADHLRFRASQGAMLDALLRDQEWLSVDATFERFRERLRQFDGIAPLDPPTEFQGSLRPYQREGLGWMAFLRWFGMGGILADDMGLGKTIQVLAVLQGRKLGVAAHSDAPMTVEVEGEEDRPHKPSLVVAPRSVVFNWIDEAQRFTPELRVQAYTGSDRQSLRDAFCDHDVIITSYGLLRRDIAELREHEFDYVVLDEAQAIKNPASQAAKAARLLNAEHRLALTGTPVENHLGDLWSIFQYLNAGMLGSSARFGELVRASTGNDSRADAGRRQESIAQVATALRPFILRRTKRQVLKDLPEKTEQTIVCEMEPTQRRTYDELRQYYRGHLLTKLDGPSDAGTQATPRSLIGGKSGFMVLEALLRLRQAACHPGLIDEKRAEEPSAKLDVLLEMLGDVIEEGSKALVFSQFTSMLALVRKRLDERGITYSYLDGKTRNRREVVQQFQNDPAIPAFLISLKSGGFGLNLTAAEYVFILDPWWNPAVEQQAIDRTHRIGQTQRVFAYRLICQDTVEQRILSLQQRKREIADAIVGGAQNLLQTLTRDDLEQLLS